MNTKKTLVAVIAAMLVAATLPCFAKGNVVTQWRARANGNTVYMTFYSDKTFEMYCIDEDGDREDLFEGAGAVTYSGDTTKNGKISIVAAIDGSAMIVEIVGDALDFDGITFAKVKK